MVNGIDKAEHAIGQIAKWYEILEILTHYDKLRASHIFKKICKGSYDYYYLQVLRDRGLITYERVNPIHVAVSITDKGREIVFKQKEIYEVLHNGVN